MRFSASYPNSQVFHLLYIIKYKKRWILPDSTNKYRDVQWFSSRFSLNPILGIYLWVAMAFFSPPFLCKKKHVLWCPFLSLLCFKEQCSTVPWLLLFKSLPAQKNTYCQLYMRISTSTFCSVATTKCAYPYQCSLYCSLRVATNGRAYLHHVL